MPAKKNSLSKNASQTNSGFSLTQPTNGIAGTTIAGTTGAGAFSLAQKPGLNSAAGGSSTGLTPRCGISDIDEIQQAYAPLVSVVDQNNHFPTVESVEPGGAKQPNKSCELYCWVYSPINRNVRSLHDMHDIQRREADKRNPDPSNLESEKIIGTANLKRRFDKQVVDSGHLKKELNKVRSALAVVERSARKDWDRVLELERDQARLYHKFLTVLRKVELLRCHGSPISLNEQRYREQMGKIMHAMQSPNLKIQELLIVQSQIDRSFQDVLEDDPPPREVEKLCSALEKQREGLQYLTDILSKDARDMDIIRQKMSQATSASHERHSRR